MRANGKHEQCNEGVNRLNPQQHSYLHIYISIYGSIKVKLLFPLRTTYFCQKCGDNNHLTRIKCSESYRLVIPGKEKEDHHA